MTAQTARNQPAQSNLMPQLRFYAGVLSYSVLMLFFSLFFLVIIPTGLFGWKSLAITSGSMRPGIREGDIVVARPIDPQEIEPGTVIVFEDPAGRGLVTHRVISINDEGLFITRGDANWSPDSDVVHPEDVVGTGAVLVPFLGLPQVWVEQGEIAKLAALAVAVVAVIWTTRWGVLPKYDPWRNRKAPETPVPGPEPVPLRPENGNPGAVANGWDPRRGGADRAAAFVLLSGGLAVSALLLYSDGAFRFGMV